MFVRPDAVFFGETGVCVCVCGWVGGCAVVTHIWEGEQRVRMRGEYKITECSAWWGAKLLPQGDSLYTTNLSPPLFSRISLSVPLLIAAMAFLSRHTPFEPPRSYVSTPRVHVPTPSLNPTVLPSLLSRTLFPTRQIIKTLRTNKVDEVYGKVLILTPSSVPDPTSTITHTHRITVSIAVCGPTRTGTAAHSLTPFVPPSHSSNSLERL